MEQIGTRAKIKKQAGIKTPQVVGLKTGCLLGKASDLGSE
jgi:hypothetical protein